MRQAFDIPNKHSKSNANDSTGKEEEKAQKRSHQQWK